MREARRVQPTGERAMEIAIEQESSAVRSERRKTSTRRKSIVRHYRIVMAGRCRNSAARNLGLLTALLCRAYGQNVKGRGLRRHSAVVAPRSEASLPGSSGNHFGQDRHLAYHTAGIKGTAQPREDCDGGITPLGLALTPAFRRRFSGRRIPGVGKSPVSWRILIARRFAQRGRRRFPTEDRLRRSVLEPAALLSCRPDPERSRCQAV